MNFTLTFTQMNAYIHCFSSDSESEEEFKNRLENTKGKFFFIVDGANLENDKKIKIQSPIFMKSEEMDAIKSVLELAIKTLT